MANSQVAGQGVREAGGASWTSLGESAVILEFGDRIDQTILRRVWGLTRDLQQRPLPGMIECVAAYATVTVFFDLMLTDGETVGGMLFERIAGLDDSDDLPCRAIEIPVCYGGDDGPDLDFVARSSGLTAEEVVAIHSAAEYLVYLIGFAPGFPYLGGMSPRLAVPRLDSPRLLVPAGSVAIAGEQTGVYPLATPGGWRLIGRTPRQLFRPDKNPPSLLVAGDIVRFRPITSVDFLAWSEPAWPEPAPAWCEDWSCQSK